MFLSKLTQASISIDQIKHTQNFIQVRRDVDDFGRLMLLLRDVWR